jgi:hypothetical protein
LLCLEQITTKQNWTYLMKFKDYLSTTLFGFQVFLYAIIWFTIRILAIFVFWGIPFFICVALIATPVYLCLEFSKWFLLIYLLEVLIWPVYKIGFKVTSDLFFKVCEKINKLVM